MVWAEGEKERWLQAPVAGGHFWIEGRVRFHGRWEELDDAALRLLVGKALADMQYAYASDLASLPARLALAVWEAAPTEMWNYDQLRRFVAMHGLGTLPGLLRYSARYLTEAIQVFLPFRSPRLAPLAAEALVRLKAVRPEARGWLLAHDECAAVGLIPDAVGAAAKRRAAAGVALRFLAANGREELILDVAGRWGEEARAAVRAVLDVDPLDLLPIRLPEMPPFWQPAGFARPLLRGRTAALPLPAVEALGTILAISPLDEPYAGLDQVREACEPASLADFAWDLFTAWLLAGAPPKESWAFQALGHLGDDACARRLAPLVRQWPGEAAHVRAAAGVHQRGLAQAPGQAGGDRQGDGVARPAVDLDQLARDRILDHRAIARLEDVKRHRHARKKDGRRQGKERQRRRERKWHVRERSRATGGGPPGAARRAGGSCIAGAMVFHCGSTGSTLPTVQCEHAISWSTAMRRSGGAISTIA